jgi:hypothetical protein
MKTIANYKSFPDRLSAPPCARCGYVINRYEAGAAVFTAGTLGYLVYTDKKGEKAMKTSTVVGLVLIVLGVLSLGYKSFSYKSEETLLKVGPVEATADTRKTVGIPAWAGIAAIVVGAAVIVVGRRG